MTITQLYYVLALAEHKNFTIAAEYCCVTQPTLSMQIQKLEDELQVKIFDRNQKPIQLTKIGEEIVVQAKNIIIESERIKDVIDQQKGIYGGNFRVGVIPTIMPTLVPMFLSTYIKKYPKVNLILEEHTTEEVVQRLKTGKLDMAIAATPLSDEKIVEKPLYYEPFVGYFPPKYGIDKKEIGVQDLKDNIQDLLLLQDGHCLRENILNVCNPIMRQNKMPFEIKSGSIETLIHLANEGLGFTIIPYLHTLNLKTENKEKLKPFEDPKPSREVSIIHAQNAMKIHLIDSLHKVIKSVIKGAIAYYDVQITSPTRN